MKNVLDASLSFFPVNFFLYFWWLLICFSFSFSQLSLKTYGSKDYPNDKPLRAESTSVPLCFNWISNQILYKPQKLLSKFSFSWSFFFWLLLDFTLLHKHFLRDEVCCPSGMQTFFFFKRKSFPLLVWTLKTLFLGVFFSSCSFCSSWRN